MVLAQTKLKVSEPSKMLGLKQKESNSNFIHAWQNIESIITKQEVDNLIGKTIWEMKQVISDKKFGCAWSGGKDSVVVEFLCSQIGNHPSCIGMTDELEYKQFMQYVTNNMPQDLIVYNSGHTLEWLSNNLDWLFPQDGNSAKRWFKAIQHSAQNKFFKGKDLEVLITGRRKKDMNYTGKNGVYKNKGTGVLRYSPIYQWTHEEVMACMKYYKLPVAPFYSWDNGWVVGSGCWAARQWTGSTHDAWSQVYKIEPEVVMNASRLIPSAKDYVRNMGL